MGTGNEIIEKADYDLRPIWDANLEIYSAIEELCSRHGFHLYAGYGTALGAIRHHGFIPWDDDMDLLLPRPEYDEFFRIANTELPSHLRAVYLLNDVTHPLRFGKIYETRVDVLQTLRESSNFALQDGLSIDIFPLDGVPNNQLIHFIWQSRIALYKAMMWSAVGAYPYNATMGLKFRWLLGDVTRKFFFSKKTQRQLFIEEEDIATSYNYERSDLAGFLWASRGAQAWRLPKDVYGVGKMVPFDRINIRVPSDFDRYLKAIYGDYMKLPPSEKQVPMHLL